MTNDMEHESTGQEPEVGGEEFRNEGFQPLPEKRQVVDQEHDAGEDVAGNDETPPPVE
jgi:hypothetical protein